MEFEIVETATAIRWINFSSFIESEYSNSKIVHDKVILFVTFNSTPLACQLLSYLEKENEDFNTIVLDNNSKNSDYECLRDAISKLDRPTTLLRTVSNLGGAGGYAAAIEYALAGAWNSILITEDDAVPIGASVVSKIFKSSSGDSEILIYYKNVGIPSFSFHFHLYPRSLLEEAGVPDPRFFQMGDDFEWLCRLKIAAKNIRCKYKVLEELYYVHPILKDNQSNWGQYFHLRNRLITDGRHGKPFHLLLLLYSKFLLVSLSKFLSGNNRFALLALIFAMLDLVPRGTDNLYKLNQKRFSFFRENNLPERCFTFIQEVKVPVQVNQWGPERVDISSSHLVGKDLRSILGLKKWTFRDIVNIFVNRVPTCTTSLSSPWRPIFLLSKEVSVISAVEFDNSAYTKKRYKCSVKYPRIVFFETILCFIFAFFILSPFLAFLYIKRRSWTTFLNIKKNASGLR